MIRRLAILLAVLVPIGANAHDQWADGTPVSGWVKQYCCGPDDVHRFTVAQIQHVPGGWRIDGFDRVIPDERVMPSQDEFVWVFYTRPDQGNVYCFFIPPGSV
jgi:hypothetical protein